MPVVTNDFSTILQKVRTNLLEAGVRYFHGDATSDGSATGTTIISTNLAELDDADIPTTPFRLVRIQQQVQIGVGVSGQPLAKPELDRAVNGRAEHQCR